MVSTGWRTACAVIVIIVGAALLTFVVHIHRRHKLSKSMSRQPDMQQRFMSSYAGDPESHMPLMSHQYQADTLPPVPSKPDYNDIDPGTRERTNSGASASEWGTRVRAPLVRVPVPPLFPEPMLHHEERPESFVFVHAESAPPMPIPELPPTPPQRSPPFPIPPLRFPRTQFNTSTAAGRKGKSRIPSLHIEFQREHVSDAYAASLPSATGTAQTPSMESSSALHRVHDINSNTSAPPLTAIQRVSPITTISIPMQRVSPSPAVVPSPSESWRLSGGSTSNSASPSLSPTNSVVANTASGSDTDSRAAQLQRKTSSGANVTSPSSAASIHTVGQYLFARKLSSEGRSDPPSRGSSYQASAGSGSGSGSSLSLSPSERLRRTLTSSSVTSRAALRRSSTTNTTTWVSNVFASYSPWHGVLPMDAADRDRGGGGGGREQRRERGEDVESPTNQIRVTDAYRPMPTLQEMAEAGMVSASWPDSDFAPMEEDGKDLLPFPSGLAVAGGHPGSRLPPAPAPSLLPMPVPVLADSSNYSPSS